MKIKDFKEIISCLPDDWDIVICDYDWDWSTITTWSLKADGTNKPNKQVHLSRDQHLSCEDWE